LKSKESATKLKTINPATEEILNEYEIISKEQVDDTVKKAKNAFFEWKKDIDKRAEFLYAFAKELRKNKEKLAKTATQEMGKAIKEARSEVEKCAWTIEYYADHGKIFATGSR
jgi:acyl-CoA reductase-like NAD-dependent aldehyde dehydrogenase